MPPRWITAAILIFWLATTGALVYEEFKPRFQSGAAPPFTIPLTAEVGDSDVRWIVLQKGQEIGNGSTKIKLQANRIFELSASFKLKMINVFVEMHDVTLEGSYRVTEEGRLLSSTADLAARLELFVVKGNVKLKFQGEVTDRMYHPQLTLFFDGQAVDPPPLEPFSVSDSGSVLNPMHLVHRISGLREGRSWHIPLMDPSKAIAPKFKPGLTNVSVVDRVIATVSLDTLSWSQQDVPCFKIEYSKPGDRPLAATWVRRSDDAVLQQWASYEGIEYTLQRVPGD